ncbi:UPF0193 protein EVG1 [Xenopus laevis]|uniref:UPF0193 protein EVG1 n=2 Tax=Xenopus laevis TaxID=8355 RepID=A0A1L8GNX5_XENLA|nr:UPF0193 protein EVG1 [Xenopus laevis]XP_041446663.1 UPF0193 protein EVG1 [Xenopus laevis]OCT85521.1 hypothetical protein XELAEV_18023690mg [Xenopus laevis]
MAVRNGSTSVPVGTGFWNSAKPAQYSKETQELLRVMMEESKLTNFQKRQIKERLQGGDALPVQCHPSSSDTGRRCPVTTCQRPRATLQPCRPSLRPAEKCRAGDAYCRDKFHPRPTRDLNKEKCKLQNIMATGKDLPTPTRVTPQKEDQEEEEEKDRFDELVAEVQERKDFLEDMEALGRGKDYRNIINTEISQKLREMQIIDKQRSMELKELLQKSENKQLS